MKKIMIGALAVFLLSSCSTVIEVIDEGEGIKRIEQHGHAGGFSIPPEAGYVTQDNQLGLRILALKTCPDGYALIKEQYIADDGRGGDMFVWRIKCSQSPD